MKLNLLASTTQHASAESRERLPHPVGDGVRRVEAGESVDGDRQRSRQQEMAEVDPKSLGPFAGGAQVLQDARQVAAQLTLLGNHASGLVKLRALSQAFRRIEDQA